MIPWQNIHQKKPKIGETVLTYCPELKCPYTVMKYGGMPIIDKGDCSEVVGNDVFSGKDGVLTDDVTHWAELQAPQKFQPIGNVAINEIYGIELNEPFEVQIYQEDDGSYLSVFNMVYGIGDSIDESLKMLVREIHSLKQDLNEQGDDILPQYKSLRDFLNDSIPE